VTTLWLRPEHARIRSYGATVRGTKSIVRIEIEVADPASLGFLLEDLGKAQRELAAPPKPVPSAPLAIPDLRGRR
jgi:hypothetical protein